MNIIEPSDIDYVVCEFTIVFLQNHPDVLCNGLPLVAKTAIPRRVVNTIEFKDVNPDLNLFFSLDDRLGIHSYSKYISKWDKTKTIHLNHDPDTFIMIDAQGKSFRGGGNGGIQKIDALLEKNGIWWVASIFNPKTEFFMWFKRYSN